MKIIKSIIYLFGIIIFTASCSNQQSSIPAVSKGTIERLENFESKYITARHIDIWLPENYNSTQKYAVLYMHDGQMLYDSTTTWNKQEWDIDGIVQQLIDEGKIQKTIVVGVFNNSELRHPEYFPQKPFENLPDEFKKELLEHSSNKANQVLSDAYLKFLVEELKPYIDEHYSVYTDMEHTFISGSSMGGLISMYAICEYPEVFSGAACLSTHWVGTFDTTNNPIPQAFADYMKKNLPDTSNHKIYFDYGTATLDALYEPSQIMVDSVMTRHGFTDKNWTTLKFEGADHSERAWNKRFHLPLAFLLGKE